MKLTKLILDRINRDTCNIFIYNDFITLFNKNCILYGDSLLLILNNRSVSKLRILCNNRQLMKIIKYLFHHGFTEEITSLKTIKYSKKDILDIDVTISDSPIKDISYHTKLKIEEIYYDGGLIIINHPKLLYTKCETLITKKTKIKKSMINKLLFYSTFNYSFYHHNGLIKVKICGPDSNSLSTFLRKIKYLISFNIRKELLKIYS